MFYFYIMPHDVFYILRFFAVRQLFCLGKCGKVYMSINEIGAAWGDHCVRVTNNSKEKMSDVPTDKE